jgi:bifunctional DNA-binding transcriptional regulator/antitoxin component of YhaV-PrlF toxin-antitoxin module
LFASTEVGVNPIGGRLIRLEGLSAALTTPISQGTHWYSVTIGSEEESVWRLVTESSDFLFPLLALRRQASAPALLAHRLNYGLDLLLDGPDLFDPTTIIVHLLSETNSQGVHRTPSRDESPFLKSPQKPLARRVALKYKNFISPHRSVRIRDRAVSTLPKSLRDKYDLGEGDALYLVDAGGAFVLTPMKPMVPSLSQKIEEIREGMCARIFGPVDRLMTAKTQQRYNVPRSRTFIASGRAPGMT